jgi:hypothetical protein
VDAGPQVLNRPVWAPWGGKSQTVGLDFSLCEPAIGLIQVMDHVQWNYCHESQPGMSYGLKKGGFYNKEDLTLEGIRHLAV